MDFKVLNSSAKHILIRNGLVGATSLNEEIGLFDFGNVIVRKNYTECENVRIISGGAHYMGDLVGKGMLTAAIQGDNFAAPASNIILRTLHELGFNHIMGSLIIISCDTGSTLNFGLAIERALNDGLRLRQITVADNYFNDQQPKILKQSLGGIILLQKIAGAMSEEMKCLSEIYNFCEKLCSYIVSCEIELPEPINSNPNSTCICVDGDHSPRTITEKPSVTSIKVNIANLINIVDEDSASDFRRGTRDSNCAKLRLELEDDIVVLINNNMTLSKLEIYFCIKDIMEYLSALNINVMRFYVGDFAKVSHASLSLTLMKASGSEIFSYLDANTTAPGWIRMNQGFGPLTTDTLLTGILKKTSRLEAPIRGPQLSERATNILLFCMQFACSALISCEKQLNIIDTDKADGDTGTRMKTLAELLIKRMKQDKIIMKYPFTFFDNLSKLLEKSLGGSSGCIYSILFEAAAKVFGRYDENAEVTTSMWLEAFESATEALKRYGNVDFGDGTMYDPIYAFCMLTKVELNQGSDELIAFGKGVQKAEEAIEATKKGKVYPDPGAHAVGIWIRAIYEGVKVRWPN